MSRTGPAGVSARAIEIIGVAGSGKSTLARALCSNSTACRVDSPFQLRNSEHLRPALRGLRREAPLIGKAAWHRCIPTWTELKLIAFLSEWPRLIHDKDAQSTPVTVMDQGAVYALARLGHRTHLIPGTEPLGPWWKSTVTTWAETLEMVVWIDAPNDVVLHRINSRVQVHEVKGKGPREAASYIDRYRSAYQTVVDSIGRAGGPIVVRYDSNVHSVPDLVSQTLERLEATSSNHQGSRNET